jgi:predicted alpha/beta superfamily hydrolase
MRFTPAGSSVARALAGPAMLRCWAAIFALLAVGLPVKAAPAPYVLPNTQILTLPRSANGRDYLLYVALPPDYASSPAKKFPVVYAADGYWDFVLLNGLYGNLLFDRYAPPFIIVGFGYPGEHTNAEYDVLRRYDYTPVADANDPQHQRSGHASEFLDVVEHEFIPLIERDFRADPSFRVLSGNSLGGGLTIFAMLTRPGLFQAHVAASPAVDELFDIEAKFAASGQKLDARLFMSGAADESPAFLAAMERFNRILAARHYPGLAYQWRLIDGEKHTTTKAESYNRGLQFAFTPLRPER